MAANASETAYLTVIAGSPEIDDNTLSNYQKHCVRQKCHLLCMALNLALDSMNGWSWDKCCQMAVKSGIRMGINITKNGKVVMRWYRMFREKRAFIVSLQNKNNLPAFLDLNPDVCDDIKKFATTNLSQLSCESVSEYIHNVILSEVVKKEVTADNHPEVSEEEKQKKLLKRCGLTKNLYLNGVSVADKTRF
jgi:hypothetical protein